MSAQLSLNPLANAKPNTVSNDFTISSEAIWTSDLDYEVKCIYASQYGEIASALASAAPYTVEQSMALEELSELNTDFLSEVWDVCQRISSGPPPAQATQSDEAVDGTEQSDGQRFEGCNGATSAYTITSEHIWISNLDNQTKCSFLRRHRAIVLSLVAAWPQSAEQSKAESKLNEFTAEVLAAISLQDNLYGVHQVADGEESEDAGYKFDHIRYVDDECDDEECDDAGDDDAESEYGAESDESELNYGANSADGEYGDGKCDDENHSDSECDDSEDSDNQLWGFEYEGKKFDYDAWAAGYDPEKVVNGEYRGFVHLWPTTEDLAEDNEGGSLVAEVVLDGEAL